MKTISDDKETKNYQNKKPCRNCGKLMPYGNPYCYSCGTDQKTGEVNKAFNMNSKFNILTYITSSYGGEVREEGLRCVCCESTENLEYYKMSKQFKKKEVGAPFTTTYKTKPSFKFPICPNCAENFKKWKKLRLVVIVVASLWIFLSYILFNAFPIEIFIRIIYFSIAFVIIIISYVLFSKHKNNPNNWMKISGYFDFEHKFKYRGLVYSPNSKKWINYEKWVEEIKKI